MKTHHRVHYFWLLCWFFSIPALAVEDIWHWQKDCSGAAITRCEVWFKDPSMIETVSAKTAAGPLELTYQTYAESNNSSVTSLLVHLTGISDQQLGSVRSQLQETLGQAKPYHTVGLYGSGDNFQVLAPFTANHSQLQEKTDRLATTGLSEDAVQHLQQAVTILGGYDQPRKLLVWLTTGVDLNDTLIEASQKLIQQEQVRLVLVHLTWTDQATAQFVRMKKLAEQSGGLYLAAGVDDWQQKLQNLWMVNDNGGQLTMTTADLCGPQTLQFTVGNFAVAAAETAPAPQSTDTEPAPTDTEDPAADNRATVDVELEYPACDLTASEEPLAEGGEPSAGEQQSSAEGGEPSAGEQQSSAEGEEPSAGEQQSSAEGGEPSAGEQQSSAEGEEPSAGEQQSSAEGEEPSAGEQQSSAGEQQPQAEEQAPSADEESGKPSKKVIIIAMMVGLLLILGLLVLLLVKNRQRAKQEAGNNQAPTDERTQVNPVSDAGANVNPASAPTYGFLLASDGHRYPLSGASTTVGRGSSNDICLEDDTVSGAHLLIKYERSGQVVVVDLNSSNGTWINDREVSQETIESGDRLILGECVLHFQRL